MRSPEPVALVTGANRGTGQAIIHQLRDRGYRTYELNRTFDGNRPGVVQCDVSRPEQVRLAVERITAETGRIDVCVANAVDRVLKNISDLRQEEWDHLVSTNLSSVFALVKETLPWLRESRGLMVVMGSNSADNFFEGGVAYSSTKAGLRAIVENLLVEERKNGVRACLVTPGAISNLDGDESPQKISVDSVARCIVSIAHEWPHDLVVSNIEIRPSSVPPFPIQGIDRLLYL